MFGTIDARKEVVREQLRRGHSVMVLPGGIREQLWVCKPDEDVVILRKHVGFIKLAIESGKQMSSQQNRILWVDNSYRMCRFSISTRLCVRGTQGLHRTGVCACPTIF
jgi:hypothetical protein